MKEIVHAKDYKAPAGGVLARLPREWVPYAELIRLDKPAGILYFYFPYLFGLLQTACVIKPTPSPSNLFKTNALIFCSIIAFRSAAVAWNDILNADLDRQVARCRLRPMARKAISSSKALFFAASNLAVWTLVMLNFSNRALFYSIFYAMLHAAYPLTKRITNYAPVFLGITFACGTCISRVILEDDVVYTDIRQFILANPDSLALYVACVLWTVIYETIYQFQDVKDDARAGIGSMAVRHNHTTKWMLAGTAAIQVGCLEVAGFYVGAGKVYSVGACGGAACSLLLMIGCVNLDLPSDCMWWFKNGTWIVGGCITIGLLMEYAFRVL